MATSVLENYHYSAQLRKYIVQFAAIFAGIQVEVGKRDAVEPHLIHVPIKNASMDRVVASIKAENTQNKPIRLPIMSFQLVNVDQAPELRKGTGVKRRTTYMPTGGQFPDDMTVVEQRQPAPYRAVFELAVWASNQDQHYQIMEQILTLFDPLLQIQISDELFDWTKMTSVELTDIRFDENVPMGSDRRMIQTRLAFMAPIYLSIPAKVHDNYVKDIYLRIGAVGSDVQTSYDIITDLDAQGEEYEKVFSLNDVNITEN
jgi:hypothetical protein